MAEFTTRVRRGGKLVSVDAHEVVPGAIVLLEAGDRVTADLRLVPASNLQSDEFGLTVEPVLVVKQQLAPSLAILAGRVAANRRRHWSAR